MSIITIGQTRRVIKRLPDGYTELTYIQSNGNQYIDTGLLGNKDTVVKFVYTPTSHGNTFGYRNGAASNNISFWTGNPNEVYVDFNNSNYDNYRLQLTSASSYFNVKLEVEISKNVRRITNVATSEVIGKNVRECGDTITTGNMFIFNMNGSPYIADKVSAKLYSCRIWGGNTLVGDFVPARRNSDSKVGVYDLVTDTFVENAGTGDFTAGDVADVVIKSSQFKRYAKDYELVNGVWTEVHRVVTVGQKKYYTGG